MAQTNTTKPKRRTYSKELKAYLVEQALTGKRSIANLAQGHGIIMYSPMSRPEYHKIKIELG